MKAIQKTCEQMFRDDALKKQIKWMKKATFFDTDPEEAIEQLQEINNNLEFFKNGRSKMLEQQLIEEVIAKNLWAKIKAEFVWNKGHKCVDRSKANEIIWDRKRYVKVRTMVNIKRNKAKKKQDQQGDKKKSKSSDKNIYCKHMTHKWSECPDNKKSPNYTGNKGKKKRSEEKPLENKHKINKGEKNLSKAKANEAYVTMQKINQDSSPKQ